MLHYINLKNGQPFGPAKMVWSDGAELYLNIKDNFKLEGNSKLYFPEPERDVISIWWENSRPKRFTKNFDPSEAYNKWLNVQNEPKWVKEYEPLINQYLLHMELNKITQCNNRKECDKLKKGER